MQGEERKLLPCKYKIVCDVVGGDRTSIDITSNQCYILIYIIEWWRAKESRCTGQYCYCGIFLQLRSRTANEETVKALL